MNKSFTMAEDKLVPTFYKFNFCKVMNQLKTAETH